MKIEGSYVFDAPQELVWEMLLDPDVLAKVMPDCQKLEQVGDDEYKGKMKVKMGPVQGVFQGKVKLSDLAAPSSYRLQINGRGPAGMIDGAGDVRLEADGDKTIMHYAGDAKISGKIACVGQRVMESSARAITSQGLEDLDTQIQSRLAAEAGPPVPEPSPAAAPATPDKAVITEEPRRFTPSPPFPAVTQAQRVTPPSQTAYALRICEELVDEFVPADKQKWIAAGAGLLLVYLLLNWWTNLIARRVARQLQKGGDPRQSQT